MFLELEMKLAIATIRGSLDTVPLKQHVMPKHVCICICEYICVTIYWHVYIYIYR